MPIPVLALKETCLIPLTQGMHVITLLRGVCESIWAWWFYCGDTSEHKNKFLMCKVYYIKWNAEYSTAEVQIVASSKYSVASVRIIHDNVW